MEAIKDCKILIVDDEIDLLHLVERILRREGFSRIYTEQLYKNAINTFELQKPDCAILDIMLPDGDGFDLLKEFRKTSQIPVLFLSARDEDENRLLGLGLGADDYIVKPFLPKELILRLSSILRRVYFPPSKFNEQKPIFYLGNSKIDFNTALITKDNEEIPLTAKEYSLLIKLYENKNNIVTSDNLCRATWGDSLYGYENTLMVHIRRLREKIEKDPSHPKYLITIRGLGYKLVIGDKI